MTILIVCLFVLVLAAAAFACVAGVGMIAASAAADPATGFGRATAAVIHGGVGGFGRRAGWAWVWGEPPSPPRAAAVAGAVAVAAAVVVAAAAAAVVWFWSDAAIAAAASAALGAVAPWRLGRELDDWGVGRPEELPRAARLRAAPVRDWRELSAPAYHGVAASIAQGAGVLVAIPVPAGAGAYDAPARTAWALRGSEAALAHQAGTGPYDTPAWNREGVVDGRLIVVGHTVVCPTTMATRLGEWLAFWAAMAARPGVVGSPYNPAIELAFVMFLGGWPARAAAARLASGWRPRTAGAVPPYRHARDSRGARAFARGSARVWDGALPWRTLCALGRVSPEAQTLVLGAALEAIQASVPSREGLQERRAALLAAAVAAHAAAAAAAAADAEGRWPADLVAAWERSEEELRALTALAEAPDPDAPQSRGALLRELVAWRWRTRGPVRVRDLPWGAARPLAADPTGRVRAALARGGRRAQLLGLADNAEAAAVVARLTPGFPRLSADRAARMVLGATPTDLMLEGAPHLAPTPREAHAWAQDDPSVPAEVWLVRRRMASAADPRVSGLAPRVRSAAVAAWLVDVARRGAAGQLFRERAAYLPGGQGVRRYALAAVVDEVQDEDLVDGPRTAVEAAFQAASDRALTQYAGDRGDAVLGAQYPLPQVHLRPCARWVRTAQGLRAEGEDLGHCVGSYGPAVELGQSFILAIRVGGDRSTVEFAPDGAVRQHLSFHDRAPSQVLERALEAVRGRPVNLGGGNARALRSTPLARAVAAAARANRRSPAQARRDLGRVTDAELRDLLADGDRPVGERRAAAQEWVGRYGEVDPLWCAFRPEEAAAHRAAARLLRN